MAGPRKNSGKTPETLSERFLEFPSRVRLGCPKPYNSRHLRPPEHFQNSLPPQYGWGRIFFQKWFRRGPPRAGHGIPGSTGAAIFCGFLFGSEQGGLFSTPEEAFSAHLVLLLPAYERQVLRKGTRMTLLLGREGRKKWWESTKVPHKRVLG